MLCKCGIRPSWSQGRVSESSVVPFTLLANWIRCLHKGFKSIKKQKVTGCTACRQCSLLIFLPIGEWNTNNPLLWWQGRSRVASFNSLCEGFSGNKQATRRIQFLPGIESSVLPAKCLQWLLRLGTTYKQAIQRNHHSSQTTHFMKYFLVDYKSS